MKHTAIKIKPLLRWAGSKARLREKITDSIPDYPGRYVEVFAGSACVFFNQMNRDAIISDANKPLISFYRHVKRHPKELYDKFSAIVRSKEEYLACRRLFNQAKPSFERSVMFYYLNRNCFNGIYRTNTLGEFNVPFSNSRVARYLNQSEFLATADTLSRAQVLTGDFESICHQHVQSGDFVYLDPPYYVPNVRVFREYSATHFGEDDFIRLINLLNELDQAGARFLLSYPDCDPARKVAAKWNFREVSPLRSISGKVESRKRVTELLISNH